MRVLDASALVALLQREPGSAVVTQALPTAVMSAANVAEVLAKAADRGLDVEHHHRLIASLGITVEHVTDMDAVVSAQLRTIDVAGAPVLSLGDRLCLALAKRLAVPAVTADRVWATLDHGVAVELIR